MASKLSQNEIGKRIAGIRKMKSLSQEELAKSIRISRSSLAQIELGNRSVGILELYDLSIALGFSIDEFMSREYVVCQDKEVIYETKAPPVQSRNSSPELMVNKFQNVILYILERCAGKPNVGETVLNKLLYFSDFNYYEVYEEHLTGALYKKLPYGSVPSSLDYILKEMIRTGSLLRIKTNFHNYPQTRYLPLLKADLTELKASEKEIIDRVIDQMSDWSASAISNYSHKDLPWIASKEGQEIDYELVFYREPPFSVRQYENEAEEP